MAPLSYPMSCFGNGPRDNGTKGQSRLATDVAYLAYSVLHSREMEPLFSPNEPSHQEFHIEPDGTLTQRPVSDPRKYQLPGWPYDLDSEETRKAARTLGWLFLKYLLPALVTWL